MEFKHRTWEKKKQRLLRVIHSGGESAHARACHACLLPPEGTVAS